MSIQPASAQTVNFLTKYHDLPPAAKSDIDETYLMYKKPMREAISEIERSQPSVLEQIYSELEHTKIATLKLETRLENLHQESERLRDESKLQYRDTQHFGKNGLQLIKSRSPLSPHEELPIPFFSSSLNKLEQRFQSCAEEISQFSRQLALATEAVANAHRYGQRNRVGMEQIVQLLQVQNQAFIRIAAQVATVHAECDSVRAEYRRQFCSTKADDPFLAADREEEAKQRRLNDRVKNDLLLYQASKQQQPQQSFGATAGSFGGFGVVQQPQQQSGSLAFGQSGGFGQPQSTQTQQTQQQGASTGFGGFTAPASTGFGAFGKQQQQQQQQLATGSSAFGSTFGAGQQQQQQGASAFTSGGFGSQPQPTASAFGGFGGVGFGAGIGTSPSLAGDLQGLDSRGSKSKLKGQRTKV